MRTKVTAFLTATTLCMSGFAQVKELKPGFNLFSRQQDVQLGQEASAEVAKKMRIVHNPQLEGYVTRIGQLLARSPHAGNWPYEFHVVYDKNINAFSLPGGPVFLNTGVIEACDNEAQLAGVMAHEMSHINLRHATNQASKANLLEIPAMLAGAVVGNRGLLGQLFQAGIGLGANSVLLKFSRSAEAQADYNGAEMMADAGYNPMEMANFFEKLEAQGGSSRVAQFLSDHPNPGNRVTAVQDEVRQMPQRRYSESITGQFPAMKDLTMHIAPPGKLRSSYTDEHQFTPSERPSGNVREFRGSTFSFVFPDNWQVFGDQQSNMITIAPPDGIIQTSNGGSAVGYGIEASYYTPPGDSIDLQRDTQDLIRQLAGSNPGLQQDRSRSITVGGQRGLLTTLHSRSPFEGETELDSIVTVARPEGLFYIVMIAPESEARYAQSTFDTVLRSIRFAS